MELTFNELKKRDVINICDGKCLGKITDIKLSFPKGTLSGIFVPGRKVCPLFRIFDKNQIYIEECKIVKIGGDAILVDLKCADTCAPHSENSKSDKNNCGFNPFCPPPCPPPPCPQPPRPPCPPPCPPPPCPPCPPPCPPPPRPPCPPPYMPYGKGGKGYSSENDSINSQGITNGYMMGDNSRIDMDDY